MVNQNDNDTENEKPEWMDIVQEICQEWTGNAVTDGSVVTASEDDAREGAKEAAGDDYSLARHLPSDKPLESCGGAKNGTGWNVGVGVIGGVAGGVEILGPAASHSRRMNMDTPCTWSNEYLKAGVPRIRSPEDGKMKSLPRFISIQKHLQKLKKIAPIQFKLGAEEGESEERLPTGLTLYNLCGYSNCINPDHLPLVFRQHRKGINAFRIDVDGVDSWWRGEKYFFSTYADFLYEEERKAWDKKKGRTHQRKVQAKISRRNRKYTDHERAMAITVLSDGTITYEMYKELKSIFLGLSEDIFDQAIIIYSARAKAIREGKEKSGYIPDARTNPFKNYKGSDKK